MPPQLYIVPIVGTGTQADPRRPKYASTAPVLIGPWSMMDYGMEPTAILTADNLANPTLANQLDVFPFPTDLTAIPTPAQLTTLTTFCAGVNISSSLFNLTTPWGQVANHIGATFQYAQHYAGLFGVSVFNGGLTLATPWSLFNATQQNQYTTTAQSLSYATTILHPVSSTEMILNDFGVQWGPAPIRMGGISVTATGTVTVTV